MISCKTSKKIELKIDSTSVVKENLETTIKKDITTNTEFTNKIDSTSNKNNIRIIFAPDYSYFTRPLELIINDTSITSNKPILEVIKTINNNNVSSNSKGSINSIDKSTVKKDSNIARKTSLKLENKEKTTKTADWKVYVVLGFLVLILIFYLIYQFRVKR